MVFSRLYVDLCKFFHNLVACRKGGVANMTDKELKKLSRMELLELLVAQAKETERLQAQLDEANAKLASRAIEIDEAGSIAEASLKLNGVFTAAEAAAAQYLENIKNLSGQQEAVCRKMEAECEAKCKAMQQEAEAYCEKERQAAEEYCKKEKQAAEEYWSTVSRRLRAFLDEHQGLREMMAEVEDEHEE